MWVRILGLIFWCVLKTSWLLVWFRTVRGQNTPRELLKNCDPHFYLIKGILPRSLMIISSRSSEDLLHRLFVCIAGVADQLQTNFASDLRNILKAVFLMNASDSDTNASTPTMVHDQSLESSIEYHPSASEVIENDEYTVDPNILAQEALFDNNVYFHIDSNEENEAEFSNRPRSDLEQENSADICRNLQQYLNVSSTTTEESVSRNGTVAQSDRREVEAERPPIWIPDVEAPKCMSCGVTFTVVKRRHHCRNCGKIFCARCSSNSVPLPKFGHVKPVRVCNKCFMYQLMPFTMREY